MGWRAALEGLNWVVVVPAAFLAVFDPDVGKLGLGAFGPPASVTLSRWLILGGVLAGSSALLTRGAGSPRTTRLGTLGVVATMSLGVSQYRHRGVSTRDVSF